MPYRYVAAFAVLFAAFSGAGAALSAQQAGMPGMPGMQMPDTTKKASPVKTKAKAKGSKKAPAKTVAKPKSRTGTAGKPASTGAKPATAKGPASAASGPSRADSLPTKMSNMPGMTAPHDTAHAATPQGRDTVSGTSHSLQGLRADSTMMPMSGGSHDVMAGPLGIPMDRMGSGTTWIPDAISLPSRSRMIGQWDVMAHGFVFGQYDKQSGKRGDDQLGSLNWVMLMASRDVAGGHFQARTMLSLDPATVTLKGYPLLLQSGEAYNGEPLHDRQHPHDFFMELGALYQREFNKQVAWSIYAAPSGEPALGPVAFMHRPSAMDNPTAPIGHHWQDATHVSFGVITAGLLTKRWQLEGSLFNGREPDQHRWNFDPIKLDSYSGRVTFNPTANWSLTAGAGYMKSPEALHPDESMRRITASVLHGEKIGTEGQSASALIVGMNRHGTSKASRSVLLENETIFDSKNTFFGRAEFVQKSGDDLALAENQAATRFNVGTAQLGIIREVARTHWATIGLGAAGTLNFVPAALEPAYGSRNPVGALVFIRLRPFHLPMKAMTDMKTSSPQASHSHE